ncbi:MAG: hypothetical protein ACREMO_13970 [Gemmatimonadales bacterium]
MRLLLAALLVSSAACGTTRAASSVWLSPPPYSDVPVGAASPIPIDARLFNSSGGGFTQPVRIVVRDDSTWAKVWAQITYGFVDPLPRPVVDFSRDMVLVAAFSPKHLFAGDVMLMDSLSVSPHLVAILVRTVRQCGPFPMDENPVDVIRLKATKDPIRFIERFLDC